VACHFSTFKTIKNISEEFISRNPTFTLSSPGFKLQKFPIIIGSNPVYFNKSISATDILLALMDE
jgi:hypothetical protein